MQVNRVRVHLLYLYSSAGVPAILMHTARESASVVRLNAAVLFAPCPSR